MRSGGRILIIFGLVLGLIAAAATLILLRNSSAAQAAAQSEGVVPTFDTVRVVVAFQQIEPWQPIPADAIGIREYPAPAPDGAILEDSIQAAAATDADGDGVPDAIATEDLNGDGLPDAAPAEDLNGDGIPVATQAEDLDGDGLPDAAPFSGMEYVVGKISNTRIYPGQVLVQSQLVDKELEEQRLGLGGELSYIIPDGKVAVAIPIDQISSVAGALRSGDQVDIIATIQLDAGVATTTSGDGTTTAEGGGQIPAYTQMLLQRVQILRVGQWTSGDEAEAGGGMVTVIVDPQQALELKHLRDSTSFEFVLRSITDETEFVTTPVDDAYMIERYNLIP